MTRPTTVDEYLATFAEPGRARLAELRALAREAVPAATETLKWGNPAWLHPDGVILFVLSGHARHANLVFTPSTREAFADRLAAFDTGKGSVKLPYADPVPAELLSAMIAHRVHEHEVDGVGWR